MKLYFDENFSYRLSNALKELEQGARDVVEVVVAKWRTVKDEIRTHPGRFVLEIIDRSLHVLP